MALAHLKKKKEKKQVSSFGNICVYSLTGENDINLGGCGGEEDGEEVEVEGKIEIDGK